MVVLSVSVPPACAASRAATPSSSFAAAEKRDGSYGFKSVNVVTESRELPCRATTDPADRETCQPSGTAREALTANPLGRLGRWGSRASTGCENDNEREG